MDFGECARCGAAFPQRPGKGRPRKYCDLHRRNRKYGSRHEALRRATIAQAYGKPCCRCGNELTPGNVLGEPELDHTDDDDGQYLGYSHSRCNRSAGARKGNATPSPAQAAQRARWASTHPPTRSATPDPTPSRPPTRTATPAPSQPATAYEPAPLPGAPSQRVDDAGRVWEWSDRLGRWKVILSRRWGLT
ncbi:hypothetical protein GCM10010313_20300 [Streptomyces violarus]|nr:hypothetical protein GCM10010313_20300 [Streptomyces violarus]